MKMHVFTKKICRIFCQFKKSSYLCNRKREKHSPKASQAKARQNQGSARSFILERGVRFPHGLQIKIIKEQN